MKIIKNIADMQKISNSHRAKGETIAVVPTMGYLHYGHLSLVKHAKDFGNVVIMTLFVNPTQFGPNEDFNRYPRDFERDRALAEEAGVDYLFNPEVYEMYAHDFSTTLNISGITQKFEGEFRPTHFDGVALIVTKLFNATLPDFAIFGQKDYQQTLVIKQLTRDLNYHVKLIVAPTVREADGLAMSSRNKFLNSEEREVSSIIFLALEDARKAIESGTRDRKVINGIMHNRLRSVQAIRIDYASAADANTLEQPNIFYAGDRVVLLIAVYLGKTRLIDNSLVSVPTTNRFINFGEESKK